MQPMHGSNGALTGVLAETGVNPWSPIGPHKSTADDAELTSAAPVRNQASGNHNHDPARTAGPKQNQDVKAKGGQRVHDHMTGQPG